MKRLLSATYFVASIMLFGFEPDEKASLTVVALFLAFAILNLSISALIVKNQFKEYLK